jgi:glutaconyl-CoA/methylmalonyl-CoA decarboxylase subunit delta
MNHLGWGLQISALGMGLVFALLALLWGLLTLVLKFDRSDAADAGAASEGPAAAALPGEAAATPDSAPGATPDAALVAAITLAVLTHRRQRRDQAAPQLRLHWPGSLLHASRWVAAGRTRQTHSWQRGR